MPRQARSFKFDEDTDALLSRLERQTGLAKTKLIAFALQRYEAYLHASPTIPTVGPHEDVDVRIETVAPSVHAPVQPVPKPGMATPKGTARTVRR